MLLPSHSCYCAGDCRLNGFFPVSSATAAGVLASLEDGTLVNFRSR
jgi:hypothetical protein